VAEGCDFGFELEEAFVVLPCAEGPAECETAAMGWAVMSGSPESRWE